MLRITLHTTLGYLLFCENFVLIDEITDVLAVRSSDPKYCNEEMSPYEFDGEYRSLVRLF